MAEREEDDDRRASAKTFSVITGLLLCIPGLPYWPPAYAYWIQGDSRAYEYLIHLMAYSPVVVPVLLMWWVNTVRISRRSKCWMVGAFPSIMLTWSYLYILWELVS